MLPTRDEQLELCQAPQFSFTALVDDPHNSEFDRAWHVSADEAVILPMGATERSQHTKASAPSPLPLRKAAGTVLLGRPERGTCTTEIGRKGCLVL